MRESLEDSSPFLGESSPTNIAISTNMWMGVRVSVLVQGGLFLAQLINAIYNVLAEHMLTKDGANPLVFSVYRDLAAAPLLHLAALGVEGRVMPNNQDLPRLITQGFLGVFCNQVLFLVGLSLTSATVASVVNLTLPLFAAVLAVACGMDSFRWSTAAGLVLAVGGAGLMKAGGGG
eukprot:CAMPEP_0196591692 /NCGR_PEP_ID=MMETSP1081-20130531/70586_1 /TAXON_ID=36882 /ORGANISM="Pyramimonas amylifera, Strain CCMP720" /LENGTH=175 /DNA_ID=CAMNT_0041915133 /DNA_START=251 /DNA_END=774 /DNA_ORIENTATION=-